MLDDLRRDADTTPYEEEDLYALEERPKPYFLGMSPAQRLVVAVMLLVITCLIGAFALLVTEKIVLPFL